MPIIDGKEYPRVENGVVLYGPQGKPAAQVEPKPQDEPKKPSRKKTS